MTWSCQTPPWRSGEPERESPGGANQKPSPNHYENFVSSIFSQLLITVRVARGFLRFQRLVLIHILVVRAEVFQQIFVPQRPNTWCRRPGLRQNFRIFNRYLVNKI